MGLFGSYIQNTYHVLPYILSTLTWHTRVNTASVTFNDT